MLYKSAIWRIKTSLYPSQVVTKNFVWEGDIKAYQDDTKIRGIADFVWLYLFFYVVGVTILAFSTNPATGTLFSIRDAMFEFASSLSTVGLSIGVTTTAAPGLVIWTESIGMLLGRLEFYVVFLALIKIGKDVSQRYSR
ncbi:MAG: potassium transporter TrkG [Candidatus Cloacimonas sp.]|nr:potassium transporter TrkG [Candidatus Cloacimonas sp.]